jgi:FixJ family two-component response regulator
MARFASTIAVSDAQPTIVLVDDDAALRTALTFTLELDGFVVQCFDSGEALLEGRLPAPPACLVLDQHLTGITGMEAVAELRGRQITLPALLITSHPKPSVREAAGALGVTIVEKPLLTDALVLAIHRALATARS